MLQLCFVLLSSVACGSLAGYSGSATGNDIGGNDNFGYGYSGSFSGTGNPPGNIPFPHFDFNNFFSSLQKFQQDLQQTIMGQAQAAQNFGKSGTIPQGAVAFSGGFPGGAGFSFIPGPSVEGTFNPGENGASAYGFVGPNGVQQKAEVFPENPNSPNVNVRFGASDTPNGFRSVFTSSSSVTTNVDGQSKTVKHASTTVNDNGKVTTYTAKSP